MFSLAVRVGKVVADVAHDLLYANMLYCRAGGGRWERRGGERKSEISNARG